MTSEVTELVIADGSPANATPQPQYRVSPGSGRNRDRTCDPLLAVQQLVGHAKPETTARHAALPPGVLERAVLAAG
jgi:hypothetical protein